MGPSLVGPQHHLTGYGTADILFDYTRQVMPADRPGRMQDVEYWAVVAYLLKENGLLPSGTTLEARPPRKFRSTGKYWRPRICTSDALQTAHRLAVEALETATAG